MSDTEDVKLPVPSRSTGVYGGASVGGLLSERGTAGGGVRGAAAAAAGGPRSSRKVVDGLRSASSRRLYSSFASNGSSKLMNGENTDGSTAGVTGGGRVGGTGSKSCSACGVQFTWRMRRHHCRGCKKAVCDPCSRERLQLVGGDSKRHRVCHPCLKVHLSLGRTREDRLERVSAPTSIRSSPFESRNTSQNVSRDASRHGPGGGGHSASGLATYAENQEESKRPAADGDGAAAAAATAAAAVATSAAQSAAAMAAAMAAAWSGGMSSATTVSTDAATTTTTGSTTTTATTTTTTMTAAAAVTGGTEQASAAVMTPEVVLSVPAHRQEQAAAAARDGVAVATAVAVGVRAVEDGEGEAEEASVAGAQSRQRPPPPPGTGVHADPSSHQHKRPVQSAKDQNPLALPWFTGKHTSPCSVCEDLWRVAWSAREDFLRDLGRAEGQKGYNLVASSGDHLRLYAAANMFWGGQAIRLRVEMEVAVPLGFAMRWLASLTARGGVYYPYSDTVPCDMVESSNGALSVACAHWQTNLSGPRRCTLLRYVSEDGSPPPGVADDPSLAGKPRDPRPTIVFTTIEHPIMREWALAGVDVEVFPSGLVLEEMESSAGPVTKVHGLIGWDNKGTLQHMAKMSYMTERADRAMERGYLEQQAGNGDSSVLGPTDPPPKKQSTRPPSTPISRGPGRPAGRRRSTAGRFETAAAAGKAGSGGGGGTPSCSGGAAGTLLSASPGSPPTNFSPLPAKTADGTAPRATAVGDDDDEDGIMSRTRMTSRARPLSPNRGIGLTGGDEAIGTPEDKDRDAQVIRRNSGPFQGFAPSEDDGGAAGGGGGGVGGGGSSSLIGVADWTPPPGHRTIPSPARAAELEAEVAFLTRQLSVRQSLEERLKGSESDKARLITKLATAQADAARRAESLEIILQETSEKLAAAQQQAVTTQKLLADAEERARTAQRDLRLSREALRVQSELAKAAEAASSATTLLSVSPGSSSRFPTSNYNMPLAASPALRAPPPIVGGGRGKSQLLVGRTQEMGVRFALDTLKYSEDEEVVVFMLHLVQGLRHEAQSSTNPRGGQGSSSNAPGRAGSFFVASGGPAPSSGPSENTSSLARVLFKSTTSNNTSSGGKPQQQGSGSSKGKDDGRELSQLAVLLISRACENEEVANFLFWYLKLEAEGDATLRPMYSRVRKALMESLARKNAPFAGALKAAEAYMQAISAAHKMVKKKGGRAPAKTARLKGILAERRLHVVPNFGVGGAGGKGRGGGGIGKGTAVVPLPLDPHTTVLGLRPSTAYTFPSAMSPCVVEFVLSDSVGPGFKGDDLLLEPCDERPRMVTDISEADLKSWSGAGPLPRARSGSVGAILHVESAVVEAWEEEEESPAPTEESSAHTAQTSALEDDRDIDEGGEDDDDDDESFLDRRRISADAGSFNSLEETNSETSPAVKRFRDLSEAAVDSEEVDGDARKLRFKTTNPSPKEAGGKSKKGSKKGAGSGAPLAGGERERSILARQASGDLTKLRLWEQMQVLGAASQDRGSYLAIFKNGEDVRQDQLAVHMVSLMDRQLKEAGLDLKLKSYRVLATSLTTGMIEFVPGSVPMSAVLATHNNSVLDFLRHHNADPGGPLGMKREALDNFTRSCAGSCVVTYLLGVGDRHLDNLMLLPEGVLFHIDFGYLFGKDPKLMPPPFRLTKEMVEAMGGTEAPHYTVFKSLCCQAYRHLRKSAHQYLNLLSLMSGAGIKDLADDPAAVLQLVQDRFKLDLTDEQADAHFLSLVSQSMTALAPRVLEVMHQIRVAAR
ncbi:putative phosphatidylinositol 3-kinase [Ectocarpus siliculosus]|uniref:phosphatidylinositol 3-kinase n=1 Tax=Ectocarpus siliculosus TaxID=2880 RepID=D8LNH7_ECTSI|nr:putative phosphatidylinositol 3-kinase [Ectocarpus siliculosus]|eukprot:CBN77334.1 putative phosphatidylinositol 3-kinase [Ectocarpus siliculosus]